MILIFSVHGDVSTDKVIDWLDYKGANYLRINSADIVKNAFSIHFSAEEIEFKSSKLKFDEIKSCWIRKWRALDALSIFGDENNKIEHQIANNLNEELLGVLHATESVLEKAFWLSPVSALNPYKMKQLAIAKSCGLSIPESIITNTKQHIAESEQHHITKPINQSLIIDKVTAYTNEVNKKSLPEKFFPSLFQTQVIKAYEIRSIYVKGEFYSMMIFSQHNEQTKVDMRRYDYSKPNKRCAYQLPIDIEQKTDRFMKKNGYQYGAIDFIKGTDGKYYFLECNPVGQFDNVSTLCNYQIEQKIADLLIAGNGE